MNTQELLKERGHIYGGYRDACKFIIEVMRKIHIRHFKINKEKLDPIHAYYIQDIINKLARIASTPTHIDSWDDIAGYATLAANALRKEKKDAREQKPARCKKPSTNKIR